jgi:hypothetical protein
MLFVILTGCSFIKEKLEELTGEESSESDSKETRLEDLRDEDMDFLYKYIEVINNLSSQVDGLQRGYLESVPEPGTIKSTSMIFVISPDVSFSFLERNIKELKRSLYDNGELAKLKAGNRKMKNEFEKDFGNLLYAAEEYMIKAGEVIAFYKGGNFKNNLSKAPGLEIELNEKYNLYSEEMDLMKETVNRFKPNVTVRKPGNYSGNEQLYITLENAYIEITNNAEIVYDRTYNLSFGERDNTLGSSVRELENSLKEYQRTTGSLSFPESSKHLKYNFEDYFSKTAFNLIDAADKFTGVMNKEGQNKRDFHREQDAVLRNYNYLVTSYNTSLNTINLYRKLNL